MALAEISLIDAFFNSSSRRVWTLPNCCSANVKASFWATSCCSNSTRWTSNALFSSKSCALRFIYSWTLVMLLLSISFLIFAVRFKERLIAFLHFSTLSCSNDKIVLICARIREFCSKERLRIGSFSVPKSANAAESISASLSFTKAWTAGELRTSQK